MLKAKRLMESAQDLKDRNDWQSGWEATAASGMEK
jgi:hypothetical protein